MKRTVMTVLLSVILVIGVVCGVYFLKQAVALRADGESAVASAQETPTGLSHRTMPRALRFVRRGRTFCAKTASKKRGSA